MLFQKLRTIGLVLTLVAGFALAPRLAGQTHSEEEKKHRSRGGHHSFADVERYQRLFEAEERDAWQKPDELVAALELEPGSMVADVGSGTGYFARRFAVAVGPEGTVFAADIEPNMVVYLRDRADRDGQANLVPVLASADDPRLPDGSSNLIFFCDTWHHISDRVAYARRLQRDLAPGGRVVIVDFLPGPLPVGPPPEHKLSAAAVTGEFEQAGYHLAGTLDLLPHQYVLIFEAAPRN